MCWESSKTVENILGYEGTAGTEAEWIMNNAVKLISDKWCVSVMLVILAKNQKLLSEL